MTVTIHAPNGKVRSSRNLRGILDYVRVSPAASVRLYLLGGIATYDLVFDDGARSTGQFADWAVMRHWFASRRSWSAELEDILPPGPATHGRPSHRPRRVQAAEVARLRSEGHNDAEIARWLGCHRSNVARAG